MKLAIDNAADALYLNLSEGAIAETRQVAPGVMLDYDAEGRVVGIEMLSLSTRATGVDLQRVLVETLGTATAVREDVPKYSDKG